MGAGISGAWKGGGIWL
jgi:hypothetical protein